MPDSPPAEFATNRRYQAIAIILVLGTIILVASAPFVPGLLGAPVLGVVFTPMHTWLSRKMKPTRAAALVLLAALLGILLPALAISALVISELPSVFAGPGMQAVIAKIGALHFGTLAVGPELAKTTGSIASWASQQAVGIAGGVGRAVINLVIALLGLYYLLVSGDGMWQSIAEHLPFNHKTTERLRNRFHTVTEATLVDIGVTAVLQGTLVGVAFYLTGISHAALWGAIAAVASVLPVLGGSLVWVPGAIVLYADGRTGAALALTAMGVIIISNIDNVVRPIIFRKVSNIHPLVTLVGAFAGVEYFGLAGVLLGPLALAYFFEMLSAYQAEYAAVGE